MVAVAQIRLRNLLPSADALGDVLPRHLHVDTTGMGALGEMHFEEATYLVQYALEVAGFESNP